MISELCDVPFVMQNVHQPHIGHYFNYAEHVTAENMVPFQVYGLCTVQF